MTRLIPLPAIHRTLAECEVRQIEDQREGEYRSSLALTPPGTI